MFVRKEIYMHSLQRSREIIIYLPDDYATSGKRYPVMYINDGQNAFFDEEAYSGVSWGLANHHYDVIMVAIPCNYEPYKRESEYCPWYTDPLVTIEETGKPYPPLGGEGKEYLSFIKDELKPYIDATYPTDVNDTAMVGSSCGSVITFYAAFTYPEVFSKAAALSTCFWYHIDDFDELFKNSHLDALKCFYYDVGHHEGNGNTLLDKWYIYTNRHAHEMLQKYQKTANIIYKEYPEAYHNEGEWRKRVPVFLDLFYGGK